MEDLKLILYILAIVAYFIYTAWRKAFKTPNDDGRPDAPKKRPTPSALPGPQPQPRQQQRPNVPATSFEDILREMQTKMERAHEQPRPPVAKTEPVVVPSMPQIAKEREPMRALSLEDPEQARLYNRKRKERLAASDELFETKKPEGMVVPNVYAELLQNPQTVRQAFILSEIFNRKQY